MKVETYTKQCQECDGSGTITYDRPESWISRDSPPSLEEVTEDCDECGGLGEIV
jgi:DnaJ-class molecular chaperone